jgi:hypothetical protein
MSRARQLLDSKSGETYWLVLNSIDVKPGEEVKLRGKKTNGRRGKLCFQGKKG